MESFQKQNSYDDISFTGFKCDCSMQDQEREYWIITAFNRGHWLHCTKEGENYHIMGVLDNKDLRQY
jgi:hypothetical protein